MFYNWLEERAWNSILSAFTSYQIKCPMRQPLRRTVGWRGLWVVVVGTCHFSFTGRDTDLSFLCRRCRQYSFASCFQWIVNKQRLLSLQRRDGWLVSVLVSAAQYRRYRYQTDTTGIGPIPIPSTGIGIGILSLVLSVLMFMSIRLFTSTLHCHAGDDCIPGCCCT